MVVQRVIGRGSVRRCEREFCNRLRIREHMCNKIRSFRIDDRMDHMSLELVLERKRRRRRDRRSIQIFRFCYKQ